MYNSQIWANKLSYQACHVGCQSDFILGEAKTHQIIYKVAMKISVRALEIFIFRHENDRPINLFG